MFSRWRQKRPELKSMDKARALFIVGQRGQTLTTREATMSTQSFKAAREFLFTHRTDYPTAHAEFRWPVLDHFNYALDWFDAELADGPSANQPALKIVGDGAATRTFAELSAASNQIANGLRALGVQRGERILLMLGNV